ncbi:MAG TPA: endo-1,4-beta-xylanase [Gallionella sp.]|nr:endo-1,4-beta-xylanase [Gallionella sp.]
MRLQICVMLVLLLTSVSNPGYGQPNGTPEPTLRSFAAQQSFRVGVSVDMAALETDHEYRTLIGQEFNLLTPENIMKFEEIHPQRDQYNFEPADALMAFAAEHNMAVHGHVLVWHQQLPEWLTKGNFDRDTLKSILREHIQTVVGRYRGRIAIWDVASEVVGDDGNLLDTFWSRGIGPDYLELAFTWAHEADPAAQLLYNEYGAEGLGAKSDGVLQLVTSLRGKGVPVDGVGLQMHVTLDDAPAPRDVAANIRRLAKLGLDVHISEMDVAIQQPVTRSKLAKQARIYGDMLQVCLEEILCRSFTVWGASDRYSWVPEHFPGFDAALLFDRQFRPKPAYRAVLEVLRERH